MPWIDAGPDRIEGSADAPRALAAGAAAVLLVRLPDGWAAVEDRCTHAGCPFSTDGSVEDGVAICDCHGSEFDLRTGAVLRGPAREPLTVFPVRIRDGRVEVEA